MRLIKSRKIEVRRVMEWWHVKIVSPVRSLWLALSHRLPAPQNGGGLLKQIHGDVQSCGYEDVQVMWEILQRSESGLLAAEECAKSKHHQPSIFRIFIWPNINHKYPFSTSLPNSCFTSHISHFHS